MRLFLFMIASLAGTFAFGQERIAGTWDNAKGQVLVFKNDSTALWIFYSENNRDTFNINYVTDFSSKPYKLSLTNFLSGPLKGKTLYGIVDFIDINTMKFDCEAGTSEAVRPKKFDQAQAQLYKKN